MLGRIFSSGGLSRNVQQEDAWLSFQGAASIKSILECFSGNHNFQSRSLGDVRADPRFKRPQARAETIVVTTPAPFLEPTTASNSGWILSPRRRNGGRRGRRLRWRRRRTDPEVEGEGGRRWRKMKTDPELEEVGGEGVGRWRRTEPDENELEAEYDGGRRWRRRRTEPENILNILTNIQLEEVKVVIRDGE